jgi:sulfatase modifying factor 1
MPLPIPPTRIPSLPRPGSLVMLVLALAGCGSSHPRGDAEPEPSCLVCEDAATGTDGGLAIAGKGNAFGGRETSDAGPSVDLGSALDVSGDEAGALPPDGAPLSPDAPPLLAPDAASPLDATVLPADATVVPLDMAPVLPPDAAPVITPPDAPPVFVTPDASPDLAPDLAPDLPPPPPPDLGPPPGSCPAGPGPVMVKAELASKPFCIDSTEVTNVQYADFLAATGEGSQTGGQPAACAWNTSFVPSSDDLTWPYAPGKETRPVVDVDWCDARAYCAWAGKRLCGKIGGGSLTGWSAGTSPTASQWDHACSRNGQRAYPYGSTFNKTACNISAPSEKAQYIAAAASFPLCEGGYPGLFDLNGNVEEWIDACDKNSGSGDLCGSAGASAFLGGLTSGDITCADSIYGTARNTQYLFLGFRCCSDL